MVVVDLLWRRRCKAKGAATSTGGGAVVSVLHSRQRDVLMIDVTFFVWLFGSLKERDGMFMYKIRVSF